MALITKVLASAFFCTSVVGDTSLLLERMQSQARRTAQGDPKMYPTLTSPGKSANSTLNVWKTEPASNWVSGFYPGLLWQLYDFTGDDEWATLALQWTEGMRGQATNNDGHDIGFKIFNSFGMGLLVSPAGSSPAKEIERLGYKDVVLTAAATLATRFDATVGCTMSWNPHAGVCMMDKPYFANFPVIIDNMMNLELLFWAAANGGDIKLHQIAESHANTTAKHHVREDGSTFHVVDYDPHTGDVARQCTHQGLNDSSTWSRGQGWCTYGFTMSYRYTNLPLHLHTATRCADYFLAHLEEQVNDSVALWDFAWPGSRGVEHRDVSASALVASALFELAGYVPTDAVAGRYRAAAAKILDAISVPADEGGYLGDFESTEGVLVHATVTNPEFKADGADVSLIYGGYYAMEALRRQAQGDRRVVTV